MSKRGWIVYWIIATPILVWSTLYEYQATAAFFLTIIGK